MSLKLPYRFFKSWITTGITIAKPALDLLSERLEEASRVTEECTDPTSSKHPLTPISALIERHGRFETAILCAAVENMTCVFFVRHYGVRGAIKRTLPMLGERARDTFDTAYDHLLNRAHAFLENAAVSLDIDNPSGVPMTTPGKVFCTLKEPSGLFATAVETGLHYALASTSVTSNVDFVKALPNRVATCAMTTSVRIWSPCLALVDRLQESSVVFAYLWRRILLLYFVGLVTVSVTSAFCSVYIVHDKSDAIRHTKRNTHVNGGNLNTDYSMGDNDWRRILLIFVMGLIAAGITLTLCSVYAACETFGTVAQRPNTRSNAGVDNKDNKGSNGENKSSNGDTITKNILTDAKIKIDEPSTTSAPHFFCFIQPSDDFEADKNIFESESEDGPPRIPTALKGKQKEIDVGERTMDFLKVEDSNKAFVANSGSAHDLKDFLHDLNDHYQKNQPDFSSPSMSCSTPLPSNEDLSDTATASLKCTGQRKSARVSFAPLDSDGLPTKAQAEELEERVDSAKKINKPELASVEEEKYVYPACVSGEMSSLDSWKSCSDIGTLALRDAFEALKEEVEAHTSRVDEMSMIVEASLSDESSTPTFKSNLTPFALPFIPKGLQTSPQSDNTPPSPSPSPLLAFPSSVKITLEAPRRRRTQSSGRRRASNQYQPYKLNGLPLRPFKT